MDRMMATTLRYEINKGNPNSRAKKQEILIARKEQDSKVDVQAQKDRLASLKTHWNYGFIDTNEIARQKNVNKYALDDLSIIKKANILVRKAALKELLLNEILMYEHELRLRGLTFHKERI